MKINKIKVGIFDVQTGFTDALFFSLNSSPLFELCYVSNNSELDKKKLQSLDILLYNIQDWELDGTLSINRVLHKAPNLKLIAIGDNIRLFNNPLLCKLGYSGSFGKDLGLQELHELLHLVAIRHQKGFWQIKDGEPILFAEEEIQPICHTLEYKGERFTPRELEIVYYTCKEYNNQQIAEKLFLSKRTVEGYKSKLIDKLKSRNPVSLIRMALQLRLVCF